MPLREKVALVTGAGTGIGEAIARRFAEEGARVYLFDRDAKSNRLVAESIGAAGGWAEAITGDVRRAEAQIGIGTLHEMSMNARGPHGNNERGTGGRNSFTTETQRRVYRNKTP